MIARDFAMEPFPTTCWRSSRPSTTTAYSSRIHTMSAAKTTTTTTTTTTATVKTPPTGEEDDDEDGGDEGDEDDDLEIAEAKDKSIQGSVY
ncbi:hypothetical protein NLG97_g9731 [Lecanicillium saksenae]|uniref:Uncharacterized protein n=1 Tax=Lecanicillium saksenae TaxID=468837 RepID=A0ACC1QFF7_9HYPO|nr:hypothetical protein NLG97_g9731 [Lecanicillium saksenae]